MLISLSVNRSGKPEGELQCSGCAQPVVIAGDRLPAALRGQFAVSFLRAAPVALVVPGAFFCAGCADHAKAGVARAVNTQKIKDRRYGR